MGIAPEQNLRNTNQKPKIMVLNEIRQIIYSLYQAKEITKKVYNSTMN